MEGVTSSPGNIKNAGLPNIKGNIRFQNNCGIVNNGTLSGSFYKSNSSFTTTLSNTTGGHSFDLFFDASLSSSIYKDDITTVQPASYTVLYIMKIKA